MWIDEEFACDGGTRAFTPHTWRFRRRCVTSATAILVQPIESQSGRAALPLVHGVLGLGFEDAGAEL